MRGGQPTQLQLMPSRFRDIAGNRAFPLLKQYFGNRDSAGEYVTLIYQPPAEAANINLTGWLLDEITVESQHDIEAGGFTKVELTKIHGPLSELIAGNVYGIQIRAKVVFPGDAEGDSDQSILLGGMGGGLQITQGFGGTGAVWHIDPDTSRWDDPVVTLGLRRPLQGYFHEGRHATAV